MRLFTLYIDVAVMSATIEAIVGVVIAVSAFLIIRFRKAKKKVQETLHLEETAKETEEDVVLLADEAEEAAKNAAEVIRPDAEVMRPDDEVAAPDDGESVNV